MSEFELLRNMAIGQYLPTGSALHRLDPRVKLSGTVLLMLALMLRLSPGVALLGTLLVVGLFLVARVPLSYALRGLVPLRALLVAATLLQLLFYPHRQAVEAGSIALWQWGRFVVSGAALAALLATLLSIAALVLLLTLLSLTTSVTELIHGVEGMLGPLQRLGLPAHEVSMILVIALRFVPLLGRELERLMKAQASRGADFGRGRGGILRRVRRIFPLIIPLFITALHRAEEMSVAMEARGYVGGRGRTRLVRLRMRPADWLALALVVTLTISLFFVRLKPLEEAAAGCLRALWPAR